jgi:hypothetical protein
MQIAYIVLLRNQIIIAVLESHYPVQLFARAVCSEVGILDL